MEHFELVEKLVNTFGVSFEKAKNALEASGWDPVEAAVLLEREKNGIPWEPKPAKEAPAEEKEMPVNEEKRKFSFENARQYAEKTEIPSMLSKVWAFFTENNVVIKKNSGEVFLDIPLWIDILLICAFFWAVVCILVVLLIMGYHVTFSGPQLGKKNVKGNAAKVEEFVEDVVEEVKVNIETEETAQPETKAEKVVESIIENAEKKAEEITEEAVQEVKPESEENQDPSEPQA